MGGCATKPKDSDFHPNSLRSDSPESTLKKVQGQTTAQVSLHPHLLNWASGYVSVFPDPPMIGWVDQMRSSMPKAGENNNGGEGQKEEQLVNISEQNPVVTNAEVEVDASPEAKAAIRDLVCGIGEPSTADNVTAKQTEDIVGAGSDSKEQIKEQGVVADLMGKTNVEPQKTDMAATEQLLNSQSSEEKGDSPLVSASTMM
ncbi:hypothetical protein HHK36_029298 [Tetracentron sinense]|uniref:Uncharacterized protein n=1 Tax=Tetracentron sinense TaxID=13715 RepID=A0A834YEN6_TETSI|nr:hypothetical protein HHK36_029298 [Tetracentron sinense]